MIKLNELLNNIEEREANIILISSKCDLGLGDFIKYNEFKSVYFINTDDVDCMTKIKSLAIDEWFAYDIESHSRDFVKEATLRTKLNNGVIYGFKKENT